MQSITDLPCELVATVLSNLTNFRDLVSAICSCRHLYTSYRESPRVASEILLSFFPPDLLPLAVAAECVTNLEAKDRTANNVQRMVDQLCRDRRILLRELRSLTLQSIYAILQTEDAITSLAFDFAERAWEQFYYHRPREVGLSISEASRFFRVFYRFEILVRAFRTGHDTSFRDPRAITEAQLWLLSSFAQFEIEQLACVYDYLEKKLMIVTLCVFIQDVELCSRRWDFVSIGRNPWKEHCISQGARFLIRLSRAPIEAKGTMLRETMRVGGVEVFLILSGMQHAYFENRSVAIRHPRDTIDTDSGPPSAFDYAHMDLLEAEEDQAAAANSGVPDSQILPVLSTMAEEDAGFRERAYVLWDMGRMKDWDLWEQIEICPRDSTTTPTDAQVREMRSLWRRARQQCDLRAVSAWVHWVGWTRVLVKPTEVEIRRLADIFEPWGYEALGLEPKDSFAGEQVVLEDGDPDDEDGWVDA